MWADRSFLRDLQYKTDVNLTARQSIYAYHQPPFDLVASVLDLAASVTRHDFSAECYPARNRSWPICGACQRPPAGPTPNL